MIRLCIAGKNSIAVDVLQFILDKKLYSKDEIVVVCNKNETGENSWQKSLRYYAKLWGIKEVQLEDVYKIKDLLFLSLEFDRIVKPKLFNTKYLYNVHFSALPKYKGMYTSALPLLHQEKESGVTFHYIDEGIDTGDIVEQILFKLEPDETARSLYFKCIHYGTQLVCRMLERMQNEGLKLPATPQSSEGSTYFSKKEIDYKNLSIDLNRTAAQIKAQIQAFTFKEYQLPQISGGRVERIFAAEITNVRSTEKPGTVLLKDEHRMIISSVDYNVVLYIDR